MQLTPPRLRDTTLGDVLGACHRARLDASLELDDGRRRRVLHLRRGQVCAVEGEPPCFGELASARGLIEPETIERTLRAKPSPQRIGQRLVAARLLSSRARDALVHEQRALRLDALFGLEDAAITLSPMRPLPAGAAELSPMLPSRVLSGRPRRRARVEVSVDPSRREALAVLGLGPDATTAALRERYRSLVLALHPDRDARRSPERDQRLREVLNAWRSLSSSPR
ncbi:MAG: J domain-containing protein [Polyangiales bacterium]